MDELVKILSKPSQAFVEIPLTCMSFLLGAGLNAEANAIKCPGGVTGFVVYGPYLPLDTGFYEVELDISTNGRQNPRLHVELWTGSVLCKRQVLLERTKVNLSAWIATRTAIEIRLYTTNTEFEVHRITIRRVDPALLPELAKSAAERAARRHRLQAAIGVVADDVESRPTESAVDILHHIISDPCFTWIEEANLSANELVLRRSGISPEVVHAIFARNNTRALDGIDPPSELTNGYPSLTNHFQLDIIKKGFLELTSPFYGDIIKTDCSFPIYFPDGGIAAIVYEFSYPHHIIVSTGLSWSGAISFIWFVDHDILIHDAVQEVYCEWGPIEVILRNFVQLCERYRMQTYQYRKSSKTVACFAGCNSNLGHYFWNDISGVERVLRGGHQPIFVLGRSKRLSTAEIFEDDALQILASDVGDDATLFMLALKHNLLMVRPTGNAIDEDLAAKVERAAMRQVQSGREQVTSKRPADGAFVLFYNLRAHNKTWVEQVEGAVVLVNRLRDDLQIDDVVLFLDGYEDCQHLVQAITDRLKSRCSIVNGTKATFAETVIWAYRCDFFVAVVGSGLVLLTWLAAKPGVCHGDRRHMGQLSWWGNVRSNAGPLLSPDVSEIVDVKDHAYADYNLNPALISDLAIEFLKSNLRD